MRSLYGFCLESKRKFDIKRRHQHFNDCVYYGDLKKVKQWLLHDKTIDINGPCVNYLDTCTPLFYILQNVECSIKNKEDYMAVVKLFLHMGANTDLMWNTDGWFPNFGIQLIIKRRCPYEVLQLFLTRSKRSDINESSNWNNTYLLALCLKYPNYKKFQLLLCYGLRINNDTLDKLLPLMERNRYYKRFWRRNQHKRKTSALIKSWPTLMLVYCLLAKSYNMVFDL